LVAVAVAVLVVFINRKRKRGFLYVLQRFRGEMIGLSENSELWFRQR